MQQNRQILLQLVLWRPIRALWTCDEENVNQLGFAAGDVTSRTSAGHHGKVKSGSAGADAVFLFPIFAYESELSTLRW